LNSSTSRIGKIKPGKHRPKGGGIDLAKIAPKKRVY
jgi:hypothetical protein